MATTVNIEFYGLKELEEVLQEVVDDFGAKDARKILVGAAREAMTPVLAMAKSLAPKDTGALAASLQIEARKPTARDKRSKYVSRTDTVIGLVTTAPGKKLATKSFTNSKTNSKQKGIPSDGRAAANEFGTAEMPAHPFMRPALESRSTMVLNTLGDSFGKVLDKYKAKEAKRIR